MKILNFKKGKAFEIENKAFFKIYDNNYFTFFDFKNLTTEEINNIKKMNIF